MKTRLTILLLSLSCCCVAQSDTEQLRSTHVIDSGSIDSLKNVYGYNKVIPVQFEIPIYVALSHYPELDSTKIEFKKARIKTTLNARPTLGSLLFRKKSKRKYIVRINSTLKDSNIVLDSVPLNATIGLFGHEFNHFVDYSTKNIFGVIARLIAYSSKKSKEKFEKEIDLMTINRGLGWELYDWSYYVLNESVATEKYKKFKRRIYLEPEEIEELIKQNNTDN